MLRLCCINTQENPESWPSLANEGLREGASPTSATWVGRESPPPIPGFSRVQHVPIRKQHGRARGLQSRWSGESGDGGSRSYQELPSKPSARTLSAAERDTVTARVALRARTEPAKELCDFCTRSTGRAVIMDAAMAAMVCSGGGVEVEVCDHSPPAHPRSAPAPAPQQATPPPAPATTSPPTTLLKPGLIRWMVVIELVARCLCDVPRSP